MKLFKEILEDVLYASKITSVGNKKLILFTVVFLSQLTAFSDVALIVIFAAIITDEFEEEGLIGPIVEIFLENIYLVPFLVIARFAFTYTQSMTMKKLEMRVTRNIKVHLLREVFEKRNYSVADAYFYGQLAGHVSLFGFASVFQTIAYIAYLTIADAIHF